MNTQKVSKVVKEVKEWLFCFVIAYVIYLVINYFFIAISGVKQVSMIPTALEGDKLFITRPVLFKHEVKRGDIITFYSPLKTSETENTEDFTYPVKGEQAIAKYETLDGMTSFFYHFIGIGKISYIKRVIGVAGDHIEVKEDGYVYRNGEKLEESYTKDHMTNEQGDYYNVIVPQDTVFVMGDNRLYSLDSRSFGCIPLSKIEGYVNFRIWPLDRIGSLE